MKLGIFAKTVILLILLFAGLKLIQPPILNSLLQIYMTLATVAVLIYVSANPQRFEEWLGPLKSLVFDDKAKIPRLIVMAAFPLLAGYYVYCKSVPALEPPATLRIVHPAPPSEIDFKGKKMVLVEMTNPFRVADPDKLKENIQEGKKIFGTKQIDLF